MYVTRKPCGRCGTDRWLQLSSPSDQGRVRFRCVECQRVASRKPYLEAIAAYGGACATCGETDVEVLTLDHVSNDGGEHRRELGRTPHRMGRWAKRNGYPPSLQVLCANCQLRKLRRMYRPC